MTELPPPPAIRFVGGIGTRWFRASAPFGVLEATPAWIKIGNRLHFGPSLVVTRDQVAAVELRTRLLDTLIVVVRRDGTDARPWFASLSPESVISSLQQLGWPVRRRGRG